MAKMNVAAVEKPGAPIKLVEREVPKPGRGQVLIKVEACGLCHSDLYAKEGTWPGISFPRVPGHEIAGVVQAAGEGVERFTLGARVGVGWTAGHCGRCDNCRRGAFIACEKHWITGLTTDGGYAEFVVAREEAVAALPDALSFEDAAPILCAGVTTYNALRHSGARPGDLVAVQGIGGLGHLGVQFAAKMGFRVAAVSKGADKEPLARKLGAHEYLDDSDGNAGKKLAALGGARVILATAPNAKAMTPLVEGLGLDGTLMVCGASMDPIQVSPIQLIGGRRSVRGWASGSAIDSEDALRFCALTGVRPMLETFPRAKAAAAYERMIGGKARFRVVMTR